MIGFWVSNMHEELFRAGMLTFKSFAGISSRQPGTSLKVQAAGAVIAQNFGVSSI